MKDIKIIVKRVGEAPTIDYIPNTLDALKKLVDGYIETVTLAQNIVVICNRDGKLIGLPYNCKVCNLKFCGTIVFVGVDETGEEFADCPLTLEDAALYGFDQK